MLELAPIIKDLALILGTAGVVTLVFQYIRQPVVLGYLVSGIIVGPHFTMYGAVTDVPNIKVIAELGVIFLMFSLGLDFSFHKLARVGFSATITGLLEVVLMLVIGFITAISLGWNFYESIFLGAALSISSTTIIIKALEELRLKSKRFAELVFGILIVEDLLAILLLVALASIAMPTRDSFFMTLFLDGGKLLLVVGSWFLIGYFLVPFLFRRIIDFANQETLTVISVAFCLLLVCVAGYYHYSPALGAFIMGSILAETPQVYRIEELTRPIRDVFAAVFFVSVGMLIDPVMIWNNLPIVILISLITIFGKIITSTFGALLTGQSVNTSLRVGFSMAQIGEFSFIIVGMGVTLNLTQNALYTIVVAVSAITTFTTPYLILLSGRLVNRIEKLLPENVRNVLNSYSSWVFRSLADKSERVSFGSIILRIVVNGIIVALVFTLIDEWLSAYLAGFITQNWLIEVLSWLTALVLSSPFIWAMLFAVHADVHFSASSKNAATMLIVLIWTMVFAEVIFLSIAYFYTWAIIAILLLVALLFFSLTFRRLKIFYYWFEKNMLANIGQAQHVKIDKFKKLAPWENRLVTLMVADGALVVGKTLQELQVLQNYGINIVAIQRHYDLIVAPRGDEELKANDKLVVLGDDEQIENFKTAVENQTKLPRHAAHILESFKLKAILLHEHSQLVGKTIRESGLREQIEGLVVGLEREGAQILNPDPATMLKMGDLIYMVGRADRLKHTGRF